MHPEYKNKTITRLLGGNPRHGCYFLALCIFTAGILRDHMCVALPLLLLPLIVPSHDRYLSARRFQRALREQPSYAILPKPYDTLVPAALFLVGQTFVVTSTWALGITGTFLGDYFGILMDHRVEGFPFNVLRDPMYVGSTMCFVATALWFALSFYLLLQ
jgi:phosphatidylethanolamine/phosphatidyl-N-methylethanolamine N-methyltransferase